MKRVSFITHVNYEINAEDLAIPGSNPIPTLIGEYYDVMGELAGLFADPLKPGDMERRQDYVPLRDIPLRLYRSEDQMTRPNYRSKERGDRIASTSWLGRDADGGRGRGAD